LAYFLYHGERVGTGDTVTYTNKETPYYSIGGNDIFTAYALSNWIGFADESVAPFTTLQNNLNATISQDKMNETSYKINNVHIFDVATDSVEMKKAIMEYGAITLSYNQSTAYLNSSTYSQYCPSEVDANHMVTVVGFNDNYARENFSFLSRPSKDGAWLVKNSYSTDIGDEGYFWVSYEDKSIYTDDACFFDFTTTDTYDNNYQYDGTCSFASYYFKNKIYAANIFTATENERLTAISFFQGDSSASYKYQIYKNVKTPCLKQSANTLW
jgi:C1A family cysteine protease